MRLKVSWVGLICRTLPKLIIVKDLKRHELVGGPWKRSEEKLRTKRLKEKISAENRRHHRQEDSRSRYGLVRGWRHIHKRCSKNYYEVMKQAPNNLAYQMQHKEPVNEHRIIRYTVQMCTSFKQLNNRLWNNAMTCRLLLIQAWQLFPTALKYS